MGITNFIFFINIYILINNFKTNYKKIKEEFIINKIKKIKKINKQ